MCCFDSGLDAGDGGPDTFEPVLCLKSWHVDRGDSDAVSRKVTAYWRSFNGGPFRDVQGASPNVYISSDAGSEQY